MGAGPGWGSLAEEGSPRMARRAERPCSLRLTPPPPPHPPVSGTPLRAVRVRAVVGEGAQDAPRSGAGWAAVPAGTGRLARAARTGTPCWPPGEGLAPPKPGQLGQDGPPDPPSTRAGLAAAVLAGKPRAAAGAGSGSSTQLKTFCRGAQGFWVSLPASPLSAEPRTDVSPKQHRRQNFSKKSQRI